MSLCPIKDDQISKTTQLLLLRKDAKNTYELKSPGPGLILDLGLGLLAPYLGMDSFRTMP